MISGGKRRRNTQLEMKKKAWIGMSSLALSRSVVLTLTNFRYWAYKNAWSIDGLPGMQRGQEAAKRDNVTPIKKMVGPFAPKKYVNPHGGVQREIVVLAAVVGFLLGCLFAFCVPLLREHLVLESPVWKGTSMV